MRAGARLAIMTDHLLLDETAGLICPPVGALDAADMLGVRQIQAEEGFMSRPAARVTDMHTCPMVTGLVPHVGGPILPVCSLNVHTGGIPQARVGDMALCVGPPDTIIQGSATVHVNDRPASRIGDMTTHGGVIVMGCFTVLIGDATGGPFNAGPAGAAPPASKNCMKSAAKSGAPFVRP
jgi:uncharacterized Zn-binding protein involved in type VI secretion